MHAAVALMIYAGLRREEVLWLTIQDVDLKHRLIYVRAKTIDGAFWQPKTKGNRVVPISDVLVGLLSAYKPKRSSPWFFPSPTGKRWDPDNFSEDLRDVNAAAGLSWSCLDFRHTFGSHLAQKGESLYKIATLMGNSPEICRRHYAALVPETMHDVVEFVERQSSVPISDESVDAVLQLLLKRLGHSGGSSAAETGPLRLAQ
jgi:integrase